MEDFKKISLSEMRQMFDRDKLQFSQGYISQNLAIVRSAQPALMKTLLYGAPKVLPEIRILVIREGKVSPTVNLIRHHFVANDLIFLGRNAIVEYDDIPEKLEGMGLSVSHEIYNSSIGPRIPKAFDGHLRDFQIHLEPADINFLDQLHGLIFQQVSEKENNEEVIHHLLGAFFWYVDRLWTLQEQATLHSQTREERLFSQFVNQVNEYASSEHNIDFYASHMFLSPRYMSSIIKKVSGKAAKEWIDEAIVTRAKISLKYTDMTVNQISDELHFANPSFFSKYFKRMTGKTPLEFKNDETGKKSV